MPNPDLRDALAREFANAATGEHQYGITIHVKEGGRLEKEKTSSVDYDELNSLIQGLDYIGTVDRSATHLENFQVDYRTRGDLVVSAFNVGNDLMVAVTSGTIGRAGGYFPIADLAKIKNLVVPAKSGLDAIRQ